MTKKCESSNKKDSCRKNSKVFITYVFTASILILSLTLAGCVPESSNAQVLGDDELSLERDSYVLDRETKQETSDTNTKESDTGVANEPFIFDEDFAKQVKENTKQMQHTTDTSKENIQETKQETVQDDTSKYAGYTKVPKGFKYPIRGTTTQEDMYVKYGTRTYGTVTQEEYDKVLKAVEDAVAKVEKRGVSEEVIWSIDQTLAGVPYTQYDENDPEEHDKYHQLKFFQRGGGFMLTKIGKENMLKFEKAGLTMRELTRPAKDPGDGSPSSAYDVIFRKQGDCDAYAQVRLAVSDVMGFDDSRMTGPSSSHAEAHIKIAGQWWTEFGGTVFQPSEILVPARN